MKVLEKQWRSNTLQGSLPLLCASGSYSQDLPSHHCANSGNGEPVLGITPGMSSGPQLYLCSRALLSSSLKGFPRVLSTLFFSSHLQFNDWWWHSLFLYNLVSGSCLTYTGCWIGWIGHIITLTTTLVPSLLTFPLLFKSYFGLCSPFSLDPHSSFCIHTNIHKSQFLGWVCRHTQI